MTVEAQQQQADGTTAEKTRRGFRWGAGSWFGTQLGATVWIPLLGVLMLVQGRTTTGAAVVGLGLLANAVGLFLWMRRDTREPYPAFQILLGASAVAGLLSVLLARMPGGPNDDPFTLAPSLPTLLAYPALMGILWIQERSDRSSDD